MDHHRETMRLAILSDIHGNLEAFQAVCADLPQQRLDGVVCLGDMIGYGPDPEDVIRGVRNLQCRTVLGNHEASLLSAKARNWMNFQARENSIKTEQLLSEESLAYCRTLPSFLDIGTAWFVHGYPPASVFTYLYKKPDHMIEELFVASGASLYFVGHTHELLLVSKQQGKISRFPLAEGRLRLEKDKRYIINAGSVGQPRDGNNLAKYLVWDDETWDLKVRFIPYDIEKTITKIHNRGFPDIYAERLR
jgi:predicted phosphodiesterase